MSIPSDSDSDCDACSPCAVLERYNAAGYSAALRNTFNFERANLELADLWQHLGNGRSHKTRKPLQDVLFRDTMMAVSLCDG